MEEVMERGTMFLQMWCLGSHLELMGNANYWNIPRPKSETPNVGSSNPGFNKKSPSPHHQAIIMQLQKHCNKYFFFLFGKMLSNILTIF